MFHKFRVMIFRDFAVALSTFLFPIENDIKKQKSESSRREREREEKNSGKKWLEQIKVGYFA